MKKPSPKNCFLRDKHDEYKEKGFEKCFVCDLKIGPSYMEKLNAKVAAIPQEIKQILLDAIWSGKKVGEAIDIADPDKKYDHHAMFQVIGDNIENHRYSTLNKIAK